MDNQAQHADYVAAGPLDEAEKMEPWPSTPTPSPASTAGAADGVPSSRSAGPATETVTSTAAPTALPVNGERLSQRSVSAGRSSRHTVALIDGSAATTDGIDK